MNIRGSGKPLFAVAVKLPTKQRVLIYNDNVTQI